MKNLFFVLVILCCYSCITKKVVTETSETKEEVELDTMKEDSLVVVHDSISKKTFAELIEELESVAEEEVYAMVMYDGEVDDWNYYVADALTILSKNFVTLYEVSVKKPKYEICLSKVGRPTYTRGFKVIEGWRCLLPIPYLWYLFTKKKQVDNFNMVDFL